MRRFFVLMVLLLTRCALADVALEGVTVLPKDEVDAILAPLRDKTPTLETLRAAAEKITALYRKKGYFLSRAYVPDPPLRDGVGRISALEGRLAEVDVQGNRHYPTALLKKFMQPALSERVARYDVFIKGLLLLNEFPDLRVRATLSPGAAPGTSDVLLTVDDGVPFHVTLEANNYGNRFIGTYRTGLWVTDGNLTGIGDNLLFHGYVPIGAAETTPYLQALYAIPVSNAGDRVSVSAVRGAVAVGEELAELSLRTTLSMYGVSYTSPLLRTEQADGNLSFGLFAKTFDNTLAGETLTRDELRELVVDWSGSFTAGRDRAVYSVSATQGLGHIFGGLANTNLFSSRFGAGNSFTRANLDFTYLKNIDSVHTLAFRTTGQVSSGPLVVGEQFPLGGPDSVRGYGVAEVQGDDGYTASVELRRSLYQGPHSSLQGLIFVDHGGVFVADPVPGQAASRFLTAAGIGFRGAFGTTSVRLDIGLPIYPGVNSTHTAPVVYGQVTSTF